MVRVTFACTGSRKLYAHSLSSYLMVAPLPGNILYNFTVSLGYLSKKIFGRVTFYILLLYLLFWLFDSHKFGAAAAAAASVCRRLWNGRADCVAAPLAVVSTHCYNFSFFMGRIEWYHFSHHICFH
jgi:hypothetical protein